PLWATCSRCALGPIRLFESTAYCPYEGASCRNYYPHFSFKHGIVAARHLKSGWRSRPRRSPKTGHGRSSENWPTEEAGVCSNRVGIISASRMRSSGVLKVRRPLLQSSLHSDGYCIARTADVVQMHQDGRSHHNAARHADVQLVQTREPWSI